MGGLIFYLTWTTLIKWIPNSLIQWSDNNETDDDNDDNDDDDDDCDDDDKYECEVKLLHGSQSRGRELLCMILFTILYTCIKISNNK